VVVTFVYRVCSKETVDLDHSYTSNGLFTTIIPFHFTTNEGTSFSADEAAQPRVMASKMENASVLGAEDDTKG